MTKEELDKQIQSIKAECEQKIEGVRYRFARENQKHYRWEIIKNGTVTIRIEKIKYAIYSDPPEAVYYGPWLKADGTANKKNQIVSIYQSNIKNETTQPNSTLDS